MKDRNLIIWLLWISCATSAYAQLDSLQHLKEVILIDTKLSKFSDGYHLNRVSDTAIAKNSRSLTDVIRYNSTIYLKENGYGMVSSPSFRGTNASQTAIIWNGIAINSVLNGQTDFNTIMPLSSSKITIRAGGGSAQYGSGAIGGSIHLTNLISYEKETENRLRMGYGSFSTTESQYEFKTSNKNRYIDANVIFIDSKNNYKFINENRKNENGAFYKLNASWNVGFKFGRNTISWNSNYFLGDRNFSSSLTAPSQDNYKDVTTRNLITWSTSRSKFVSKLKAAHIFERYRYFPNKRKELFLEGKATSLIVNYAFDYFISDRIKTSFISDFNHTEGKGSNIGGNNRNTLSAIALWNHRLSKRFSYNVNLRQEFINELKNPLLVGVDGKYVINDWYTLKFNASRNYRIPTFNDLYWDAGGNADLQPETSLQWELGQSFRYKNFRMKAQVFYIASEDLIKWVPNSNGVFVPVNIAETENYGAELSMGYSENIKEHHFDFNLNYAYIKAVDLERNKQLIYVPFHKVTGAVDYSLNGWSAYFQGIYNGKVFITTDNKGILEGYVVANFGTEYTCSIRKSPMTIGIRLNNLFNTYYENVASRPMPNRHYQLYTNFKF